MASEAARERAAKFRAARTPFHEPEATDSLAALLDQHARAELESLAVWAEVRSKALGCGRNSYDSCAEEARARAARIGGGE